MMKNKEFQRVAMKLEAQKIQEMMPEKLEKFRELEQTDRVKKPELVTRSEVLAKMAAEAAAAQKTSAT